MTGRNLFGRILATVLAAVAALMFLLPTVVTFSNSFMTQSEIQANYGPVFATGEEKGYISETINLKLIPDKVSFSQYATALFRSPEYLLKFWISVILVLPIVLGQLAVASIAAYGFTRWR